MKILLIIIFSVLFPYTLLLAGTQCQKTAEDYYAQSSQSNWKLFHDHLGNELPAWKVKIISSLFKSYEQNPYFNIRYYKKAGIRISPKSKAEWPKYQDFIPYAIKAPLLVTNAFREAAKLKGLRPGERYVILPGKLILANATQGFFTHLVAVLSFGVLGELLDYVGLAIDSPILRYGKEEDLEEDEIILYITTDVESNAENKPNQLGRELIARQLSRKQWHLDLAFHPFNKFRLKEEIQKFVNARLKGKDIKIKRVITSSHGTSGMIFFDYHGMELEDYAQLLLPLLPYLSDRPEFYFDGCSVASTEEGKEAVNAFAHTLDEKGIYVQANNILQLEGYTRESPVDFQTPLDSITDGLFLIHPFAGQLGDFAMFLMTAVPSAYKNQSGPLVLEPSVYRVDIQP